MSWITKSPTREISGYFGTPKTGKAWRQAAIQAENNQKKGAEQDLMRDVMRTVRPSIQIMRGMPDG